MATKRKTRKNPKSKKSAATKKTHTKVAMKPKAPKKKKANKTKSKPVRGKQRGRANTAELVSYSPRGLGASSGGQSGDTQGLGAGVDVDSESVEGLLEEGQSFEAEVVDGVENAREPDEGEVRTREVEEDDVPGEYRDKD